MSGAGQDTRNARAFLGIDVGTGSVRAGLFDAAGRRLGMGVAPITIWRPDADFAEQSSDEIWRAIADAARQALTEADLSAETVAGIGFDATCSLVALDDHDRPVSVSPTGRDAQNVIVWMDHRATEQAARITAGGHAVLRYVGGTISPEMQTPKLLWLKERLPDQYRRVARFLDLPDFLTYRATGVDARSLCTTVCKWTYLGHDASWDAGYFRSIGLGDLADDEFRRIGTAIRPMGERAGGLTPEAAATLGLAPGTSVAIGIIDAHAGGLGLLGVPDTAAGERTADFNTRLALIGGTSSCHMAVSREPRFVAGIWGPYYSAMVPGWWLTEGGQSATGALIDHVLRSHARYAELAADASSRGTSVFTVINEVLTRLGSAPDAPGGASSGWPPALDETRHLHVYPDFNGNRSPRADPTLRGMISGLRLSDTVEDLARLYLATIQGLGYGTRHIIETMNASGYAIDTLVGCGGDMKNEVFVRTHADATGCRIVLPREPEAVLLGAAMLGAVAAGAYPTVETAMSAMTSPGRVIDPAGGATAEFHARKYRVYQRMYRDQIEYRDMMERAPEGRE
jgi:FGGY-family pentulose kinase